MEEVKINLLRPIVEETVLDWIREIQGSMLFEWNRMKTKHSVCPGVAWGSKDWFVMDGKEITVIPMYHDYRRLFIQNGLPSPIEYDWTGAYRLHKRSEDFRDFLRLTVDTLEQQLLFYTTDCITSKVFLTRNFQRLARLFRVLYDLTYANTYVNFK